MQENTCQETVINAFEQYLLGYTSPPARLQDTPRSTNTFQEYDKSNPAAKKQLKAAPAKAYRHILDVINDPWAINAASDVLGRFKGAPPAPKAQQEATLRSAMGTIPMAGLSVVNGEIPDSTIGRLIQRYGNEKNNYRAEIHRGQNQHGITTSEWITENGTPSEIYAKHKENLIDLYPEGSGLGKISHLFKTPYWPVGSVASPPLSQLGNLGLREKEQAIDDLRRTMGLSTSEAVQLLQKNYQLMPQGIQQGVSNGQVFR